MKDNNNQHGVSHDMAERGSVRDTQQWQYRGLARTVTPHDHALPHARKLSAHNRRPRGLGDDDVAAKVDLPKCTQHRRLQCGRACTRPSGMAQSAELTEAVRGE